MTSHQRIDSKFHREQFRLSIVKLLTLGSERLTKMIAKPLDEPQRRSCENSSGSSEVERSNRPMREIRLDPSQWCCSRQIIVVKDAHICEAGHNVGLEKRPVSLWPCEWVWTVSSHSHRFVSNAVMPTLRVQIVCKMQVVIHHFTLYTLCCLLLYRSSKVHSYPLYPYRERLWTQSNKFSHRHWIQFILKEYKCLRIAVS